MLGYSSRLTNAVSVTRSYFGPVLLIGGVVLEILGWYGVSGQSVEARQLPFIASASIPGAALIVGGAILAAGRDLSGGRTAARQLAELHALLVEYVPEREAMGDGPTGLGTANAGAGDGAQVVALPAGTTFHDPACALVAGKPSVVPVDGAQVAARGLRPCPVCSPGPA